MNSIILKTGLIFYLIGNQSSILSIEHYVKCNKGDLEVSFEKNVEGEKNEVFTTAHFKISKNEIVEHFQKLLPNLKITTANTNSSIYKSTGTIDFEMDVITYNKYFKNRKETSANSYIQYLNRTDLEKNYVLLVSRYNKGIKIEIFENIYPLSLYPIVNWVFQDCEKASSWSTSFDPLDFWYFQSSSRTSHSGIPNSNINYKKKLTATTKGILDRHLNAWTNKNIKALMADYAVDAQVVVNGKIYKGKEEITNLFMKLFALFVQAEEYSIDPVVITEQLAYITWKAKINGIHHPIGTDTFVIMNNKIKYQTVTSDSLIFQNLN